MNTVFMFKLLIFQYSFSRIVKRTCHDLKEETKAKIFNKRMVSKSLFSALKLILEYIKMNMNFIKNLKYLFSEACLYVVIFNLHLYDVFI